MCCMEKTSFLLNLPGRSIRLFCWKCKQKFTVFLKMQEKFLTVQNLSLIHIFCTADASGSSCTITMTQQVCISVPVRYGVCVASGDTTIGCADSRGCGCR